MSTAATDLDGLYALLARTGLYDARVTALSGGASARRYHRVRAPTDRTGRTLVAVHDPVAASASGFLEVQALLHSRGVDVPEVIARDAATGWLLVEDLGDATLAARIAARPAETCALYTRAVRDLARAQRALGELPASSVVRTRAFDERTLAWELDHFREWGLDARGLALTPDGRARFDAVALGIARRIAALPRGFVHKDYQSRNLMVRADGGLAWIDFQDALLGPRVYDLVALLQDSYQSFDQAFIDARLAEYAEEAEVPVSERAELARDFDLVTVQRKLKDAGRFVFIERTKGDPSFLPYVEPTLDKVRRAMARLAGDADVRELARVLAPKVGPVAP